MAKLAVCVGINNYPGTSNDLAGCVNDALDWEATLKARDFSVTTLLDSAAKKQAIVKALQRTIKKAKSGDTVVLTYSGHGSWQPDEDGDEPDGRDVRRVDCTRSQSVSKFIDRTAVAEHALDRRLGKTHSTGVNGLCGVTAIVDGGIAPPRHGQRHGWAGSHATT